MNKRWNRKLSLLALASVGLAAIAVPLAVSVPASADSVRPGSTTLVSTYPDGTPADGGWPSVSSDGRYVAFESFDNITTDISDTTMDVFLKDTQTAEITRIPAIPLGWYHMHPSISGDGTKIAYLSGACCHGYNAYVYDRTKGTNTLIQQRNPDPYHFEPATAISISRDGKWVALITQGSDVEGGNWYELWVSDTSTGATRVLDLAGIDDPPAISATGRFIAYQNSGVFLYDRDVSGSGTFDQPGNTSQTHVSIGPNSAFTNGGVIPGSGRYPSISDDGHKVAFMGAPFIGLGSEQIYVRDVPAGTTTLVSQSSQGVPGLSDPKPLFEDRVTAVSGNGNYVAFPSFDPELSPPDLNPQRDVFVRDLSARTTRLVSYLPDGTQGLGDRFEPTFSQDGRFVAFGWSQAYDVTYGFYRPENTFSRIARRVYLRDLQAPCSTACLLP